MDWRTVRPWATAVTNFALDMYLTEGGRLGKRRRAAQAGEHQRREVGTNGQRVIQGRALQ